MTNMERMSLESVNTHAITDNKVKKGIAADNGVMAGTGTGVTFADSLYSLTAQTVAAWTPEGELNDVPANWQTDEPSFAILGEVRAAKEFLESRGVDTRHRTPTHEIAEEQRKWLESRHDFESLKNKSVFTPEFGNLMGDLYYLNVLSESEATSPAIVKPVTKGEVLFQSDNAALIKLDDDYEEYKKKAEDERYESALKYLDKMIEAERERLDEKQEDYYLDFIHGKTDNDYLNNIQSCYSIIFELLGG